MKWNKKVITSFFRTAEARQVLFFSFFFFINELPPKTIVIGYPLPPSTQPAVVLFTMRVRALASDTHCFRNVLITRRCIIIIVTY